MSVKHAPFALGKPHFVALFDGEAFHFVEHQRHSTIDFGRIALPQSASRRLDTQGEVLVRRIADRRLPIVLRLAEDMGLVCYDRFPRSVRDDLRAIVAHRLDELTPWNADSIYYDAQIVGEVSDGQVEVQIIAAQSEQVQEGIEALAGLGLTANAADVVIDFPNAPCTLNFLGGTSREHRLGAAPWFAGTAAVLALMVGVTGFMHIHELRQQVTSRESYSNALAARLADLPDLRQKLDDLQFQGDVIADKRQNQPSVLLVIEDLSGLLPDGVWLERLRISGDEITMSGFAPDAEVLLGLVERHESFSQAEFTAAIRRELIYTDEDEFVSDSFALKAEIDAVGTQLPKGAEP